MASKIQVTVYRDVSKLIYVFVMRLCDFGKTDIIEEIIVEAEPFDKEFYRIALLMTEEFLSLLNKEYGIEFTEEDKIFLADKFQVSYDPLAERLNLSHLEWFDFPLSQDPDIDTLIDDFNNFVNKTKAKEVTWKYLTKL